MLPGPGSTAGERARRRPAGREGRVHRLDRGGRRGSWRRPREHHPGLARVGRQVGERRVRRRRPGRRRRASRWAVFDNAGQDCCARSRIFVAATGLRRLRRARSRRGPTRSRSGRRSTRPPRWAADLGRASARRRSTTSRSGTRRARGWSPAARFRRSSARGGFYLRPAVLADVDNDMRVAQEEIFGPVACVIPFDTEEDASASRTTPTTGSRARCGRATSAARSAWRRRIRAGVIR